jgi:hypothetical protein
VLKIRQVRSDSSTGLGADFPVTANSSSSVAIVIKFRCKSPVARLPGNWQQIVVEYPF